MFVFVPRLEQKPFLHLQIADFRPFMQQSAFVCFIFVFKIWQNGQTDQRTAPSLYVRDKEQGHKAGIVGEKVPVRPWVSV